MPILVKHKHDWADEFTAYGFKLFKSEDAYNTWLGYVAKCNIHEDREFYFGTNQYVTYDNLEDYLNSLTTIELTQEQYDVMVQIFPEKHGAYGIFANPADHLD